MKSLPFLSLLSAAILACTVFAFASGQANALPAAGTVTNCTDAGLTAALAAGGAVTFDCGGPVTLVVTSTKTIALATTIDGSNNGAPFTLTASSSTRLFFVSTAAALTLANLSVSGLNYYKDPIYAQGTLVITGSSFTHNASEVIFGSATSTIIVTNSTFVSNTGSTLDTNGVLTVTGALFVDNYTDACGQGIQSFNARISVSASQFLSNTAPMSGFPPVGGPICASNTTLVVAGSTFSGNRGSTSGGIALFGDPSVVTVTASTFAFNVANAGAAINAESVSVRLAVSNTAFISNTSNSGNGALFMNNPASAQLVSATFQANNGGGSYVNGGTGGRMTIDDSGFYSNTGGSVGAGAVAGGSMSVTVTRGIFLSNNSVSNNFAGGLQAGGPAWITASTFVSNSGPQAGGLYFFNPGIPAFSSYVFGTLVQSNTATSYDGGGVKTSVPTTLADMDIGYNRTNAADGAGISSSYGGQLTVTNSTIHHNVISGSSGYGAGIASGGSLIVSGTRVVSNVAPSAGGVYVGFGPATVTGTLVAGNIARRSDGGGIYAGGSLSLFDTDVSANRTPGEGGGGDGAGLYSSNFSGPLTRSSAACSSTTLRPARCDRAAACTLRARPQSQTPRSSAIPRRTAAAPILRGAAA